MDAIAINARFDRMEISNSNLRVVLAIVVAWAVTVSIVLERVVSS